VLVVVAIVWTRARRDQKPKTCRRGFNSICSSSGDISTRFSDFGRHIAICTVRIKVLYFQLSFVIAVACTHYLRARSDQTPQIAVGISSLTEVVLGIKLFPLVSVILPFSVSIVVYQSPAHSFF